VLLCSPTFRSLTASPYADGPYGRPSADAPKGSRREEEDHRHRTLETAGKAEKAEDKQLELEFPNSNSIYIIRSNNPWTNPIITTPQELRDRPTASRQGHRPTIELMAYENTIGCHAFLGSERGSRILIFFPLALPPLGESIGRLRG
jgi:hypothetical protein